MKRIVVSVTNNLVSDQRVGRICQSLNIWGYQVVLVGRNWPKIHLPQRNYTCIRFNLLFNKKFLFYAEYNIRLFFFLLTRKADILIANDLDTLPANYLVSKIKRCKLFFDSHEYFPETPEVYQRKFVKGFWLLAERAFINGCHGYYTVSHSLAEIYVKVYGIKFEVLRNVPYRQPSVWPVKNNERIILYQGSINRGRGLELMIQTIALLPGVQLVIAGNGPELPRLMQMVRNLNLELEVKFTGNLAPYVLRELTRKASVGISIEEAQGKSYMAALPNKLFDYIQARVPVLVSDLPEMKFIVESYGVGEVLYERTPRNAAMVLDRMLTDEVVREKWEENLEHAAKELCWENEEAILRKFF